MDLEPLYSRLNVVCGCAFCGGKLARKDVKHYKLFSTGGYPIKEFYLHIDITNSLAQIEEKL